MYALQTARKPSNAALRSPRLSDTSSIRTSSSDLTDFSSGSDFTAGFKLSVLHFYGLDNPDDPAHPFDMLGNSASFDEVTLVHIIPRCYGDQVPLESLALSADVLSDHRYFLLLPRQVRVWFDSGVVGFVPQRDRITLRVLNAKHPAHGEAADKSGLDGKVLHIPKASEGRWPCKRILGWFAWMAKAQSAGVAAAASNAELNAGLEASADASGNVAAKRLRDAAIDVAARLGLVAP